MTFLLTNPMIYRWQHTCSKNATSHLIFTYLPLAPVDLNCSFTLLSLWKKTLGISARAEELLLLFISYFYSLWNRYELWFLKMEKMRFRFTWSHKKDYRNNIYYLFITCCNILVINNMISLWEQLLLMQVIFARCSWTSSRNAPVIISL